MDDNQHKTMLTDEDKLRMQKREQELRQQRKNKKLDPKKARQLDVISLLINIKKTVDGIMSNTLVLDNKLELLKMHMNEHREMMGMKPIDFPDFIQGYRGGMINGPETQIPPSETGGGLAKLEKDEPDGRPTSEEGNEPADDPNAKPDDDSSKDTKEP